MRLIIIVTILMLAVSPAAAQQKALPPSQHLNALAACRAITADAERLACYDREAGTLVSLARSGEIRVVDRADVRQARRSLFGFSVPRIGLLGSDGDIPDEITSTIKSVQDIGRGRYRMVLADGDAVWETIDSPMRLDAPRRGDKIVIKRGAIGSFFLRIDGQGGVKGRRVG